MPSGFLYLLKNLAMRGVLKSL